MKEQKKLNQKQILFKKNLKHKNKYIQIKKFRKTINGFCL
jgi:hypothetical protein